MEQLSFIEKLGVLFNNVLAHPLFICILLIPVLLIVFNKKITKKAIVLLYIGVLLLILFIGNTTIFALFDNLMDGIFMTLYFPNFITLFLVELLSAVIMLITFLKKDITKLSKIINTTGFAIVQMLFALILTVIQANEIDIYKENALYANNDVLTLMQLLMGTFFLQIITLVVIKAIDKVTARLDGTSDEEMIEKHTKQLEGRIGHSSLGAKALEPLVIIKEPEVKLDPIKPAEPLDKSLIINTHINPLDVNAVIKSEEAKPKPIIRKQTTEVLDDIRPKFKPMEPLDKSLIESSKISPIDVKDAITKEKVLENTEVLDIKSEDALVEDALASKKDIKETIDKTSNRFKDYISKIGDKVKEVSEKVKDVEEVKASLPVSIPTNVEVPNLDIKEEVIEEPKVNEVKEEVNPFDNFKPEFPEAKTSKFVNEDVIKQKPDLLKPMEEPIKNLKETKIDEFKPIEEVTSNEEKELITNLQIVDYDKTVKAIKNLSTVYTL